MHFRSDGSEHRSLCNLNPSIHYFEKLFVGYIPLCLIFFLNFKIFCVARRQRKRILAERTIITASNPNEESVKKMCGFLQFFVALTTAKTFAIVFAVLASCILTSTVVGLILHGVPKKAEF